MTRDDIIRMSQEAGPLVSTPFDVWRDRFAELIAAHEREACAQVCDEVVRDLYMDSDAFEEVLRCAAAIRARGAQPPIR